MYSLSNILSLYLALILLSKSYIHRTAYINSGNHVDIGVFNVLIQFSLPLIKDDKF